MFCPFSRLLAALRASYVLSTTEVQLCCFTSLILSFFSDFSITVYTELCVGFLGNFFSYSYADGRICGSAEVISLQVLGLYTNPNPIVAVRVNADEFAVANHLYGIHEFCMARLHCHLLLTCCVLATMLY